MIVFFTYFTLHYIKLEYTITYIYIIEKKSLYNLYIFCFYEYFLDEGESEDEAKEDIDIGHYSYIHACEQLGNPPIRKIFEQLQTHEISVQYVGLNTNDVIALAYGLLVGILLLHVTSFNFFLEVEGDGLFPQK